MSFLSAHARYAARAAEACGYAFHSLDGADGYLFEISDGARRAIFSAGAGMPYALNDARAASIARDKAFCAETLRRAGVPVLPGEKFFVTKRWSDLRGPGREPDDALAYAARVEYPIFCKPLSASNGLYAEVLDSPDEFADYMGRVAREHFAILIQPYIRASEHRVFVLHGRALFSYTKTAPSVLGDGVRTLGELVAALPREPDASGLRPRGRDGRGGKVCAGDIPEADTRITLDGAANRAVGGGATALADGASPALAQIAIDATHALGLQLAAVDIFGEDDALTVIEVNSNPMIATLEEHDRWDLIVGIWRANFTAAFR